MCGAIYAHVHACNSACAVACVRHPPEQLLVLQEIGRVPGAGYLKGLGYTDAAQFYYDLTKIP